MNDVEKVIKTLDEIAADAARLAEGMNPASPMASVYAQRLEAIRIAKDALRDRQ